MVAMIVICESRGALTGAIVALLLDHWIPMRRRTRVPWVLATILGSLCVVVFASSEVHSVISSLFLLDNPYRGVSSGFAGRVDQLPVALELIQQHPWVGNGFRVEDIYVANRMKDKAIMAIHNGYLGTLAQIGLLGSVPLFLVITTGVVNLTRHARRSLCERAGICLVGSFLTIALSGPVLVSVANPSGALAWSFILAAATSSFKNVEPRV
jgi:O-antigen ligase